MKLLKKRPKPTQETCKKITQSLLGKPSRMKGKHHSRETIDEMKRTRRGKKHILKEIQCPYCKLIGKGGNMSRWHGDNCKFKPK